MSVQRFICTMCGAEQCGCSEPRLVRPMHHRELRIAEKEDLVLLLERMNLDELAVMQEIAHALLGKGRDEYGPLNLATDKRDFRREAAEELRDWLVYDAADKVKRRRGQ